MPQEHYVLRCFSCEVFQVHIVKKAKKWECKMCGAKQSLKRNYGKGSGKDCRAQVMKLNELRMLKADIPGQIENESFDESLTNNLEEQEPVEKKPLISKWTEYLDEVEADTEEDAEEINTCFETTVNSKKRKKTYKQNFNSEKKSCSEVFITEDFSNEKHEESTQLNTALNCFEKFESNQKNEKSNKNQSIIQSNNFAKAKPSKYSKYLDEDEESEIDNNLLADSKKSSNIFNSDSTDLDSILNF